VTALVSMAMVGSLEALAAPGRPIHRAAPIPAAKHAITKRIATRTRLLVGPIVLGGIPRRHVIRGSRAARAHPRRFGSRFWAIRAPWPRRARSDQGRDVGLPLATRRGGRYEPPRRRNMKRTLANLMATLVAVLALTLSSSAFAGGASDLVKAKQTTLFELLKQGTPDSQKKIDAIFDDMLDYDSIAQASLGDEWAKRSPAEQAEFSDLLKRLVRSSYQRNLKKILDYDINYAGEDPVASNVKVKTTSQAKGGGARSEPIEINFTLANKGKWVVQDIETEGVSLVTSYRNQFLKIVKKDGFPTLTQKMKDKLAKGETS
jgi:phospholipid transport system substrate-binding protein